MDDKPLSEMTNEELWELFPIVLKEHNPVWARYYREEMVLIVNTIGPEYLERISHIGSTTVPGLLAKPTIDILLEVKEELKKETLIDLLEGAGYLFSPQPDKSPPHMMFMKGYTPQGFAEKVVHVHVRYAGDWDELYFCDYLREHPDAAKEYGRLKAKLAQAYPHNRDGYTEAKTEFIRRVTEQAREAYSGRYAREKEGQERLDGGG